MKMDINSREIQELIIRIAEKENIPSEVARRIIMSQFECARQNMKLASSEKDFWPYIKLPKLYTFMVSKKKKKFYLERLKKQQEDVRTGRREADD